MKIAYAVLVVLTVAVHLAFIAYMVTGGFLALRWPKTIWVQVPVVLWGISIELINFVCPLTALERWARPRAGMNPMPADGFIAHYLTGVVYPANWANPVLLAALVTVVMSWVLVARSRKRQMVSAERN